MKSSIKKANMIESLKPHVKGTVAPYKYPRDIDIVSELPRTEVIRILK